MPSLRDALSGLMKGSPRGAPAGGPQSFEELLALTHGDRDQAARQWNIQRSGRNSTAYSPSMEAGPAPARAPDPVTTSAVPQPRPDAGGGAPVPVPQPRPEPSLGMLADRPRPDAGFPAMPPQLQGVPPDLMSTSIPGAPPLQGPPPDLLPQTIPGVPPLMGVPPDLRGSPQGPVAQRLQPIAQEHVQPLPPERTINVGGSGGYPRVKGKDVTPRKKKPGAKGVVRGQYSLK